MTANSKFLKRSLLIVQLIVLVGLAVPMFTSNVSAEVIPNPNKPKCFQKPPSVPDEFDGSWAVQCPANQPDSDYPDFFQPANCYLSQSETAVWGDFVDWDCSDINPQSTPNPAEEPGQSPGGPASIKVNPPPIGECQKAKKKEDISKCKKEYQKCNQIAGPLIENTVARCKQKAVEKYTGKSYDNSGHVSGGGNGNGNGNGNASNSGSTCDANKCDLIKKYLNPTINLLSVIFGLVAAGSIILGGIQFSTSEGDPQKAARAKDRIAGTILAIFAYAFIYAFLQFLIPGGLFNR